MVNDFQLIDQMESELKAAGWTSTAAHPRGRIFISPHDGFQYPIGLAFAMLKNASATSE